MADLLNTGTLGALWTCTILAMAASSISITVTQTEIFAPLRGAMNRVHPMVGHLFHCFYCFSHWAAIAGVALYRPLLVSSGYPLADLTISVFFTIALAAWMSGLIFTAFLAAITKHAKQAQLKKELGLH